MSAVVCRFAPSPTGALHAGNLRTALINKMLADQAGGAFILRFDDTDAERSEERFVDGIRADLAWLGLDWTREERQSGRMARYDAAAETLKAAGRLYPCYETPDELALKRKAALNAGRPPIYDRGALSLTPEERAAFEAEGRQPHWRFKLAAGSIAWTDLIRGAVRFDAEQLSDPVLIRADGRPLYHLPSVVDDIDMAVSHIVRGEDHVSNSAWHVQIFEALGAAPPVFGHLALLADASGGGLSKRFGALSIAGLREAGIEPEAVISYLARIGTSRPIAPVGGVAEAAAELDFSLFGRATAKFDVSELERLNGLVVQGLDHAAVAARLPQVDAALWDALRANLATVSDAEDWRAAIDGPTAPMIAAEDAAMLKAAADALPPEPWTAESWGDWTAAVKAATGRKGKALFMPLRKALTGRESGPELAPLLPRIGAEKARARLAGETA